MVKIDWGEKKIDEDGVLAEEIIYSWNKFEDCVSFQVLNTHLGGHYVILGTVKKGEKCLDAT